MDGRALLRNPPRDGGREFEAEALLLMCPRLGEVGVLFSIASRDRDLRNALLARPDDGVPVFTLINITLLPLLVGLPI